MTIFSLTHPKMKITSCHRYENSVNNNNNNNNNNNKKKKKKKKKG